MTARDDEGVERQRQQKEREGMSITDRSHGKPKRRSADGSFDGRSEMRTGRVANIPLRGTLVVKATLRAIMQRDNIRSGPMLLELLIEAYLEKNWDPPLEIPTEEELVRALEEERDRRDAE